MKLRIADQNLLSKKEEARYEKQLKLPWLGAKEQLCIQEARVLIVGLGGLGTPASLALVCAGVRRLGLVDADHVELANLHRQLLYTEVDLGFLKVEVAKQALTLHQLDSSIDIYPQKIEEDADKIFSKPWDLVLDCTDNFNARYTLSSLCTKYKIPHFHASLYRMQAELALFTGAPCYRCLFPKKPEIGQFQNCSEAGVLGSFTMTVGGILATESLRFLATSHTELLNTLLLLDGNSYKNQKVPIAKLATCTQCS